MPTFLRNALALLAGLVVGACVNMAIVLLGPMLIPPPAGVDMTTAEGLTAGMPLLEPKHFVAPFLAHALGTLTGAALAFLLAASHKPAMAFVVGAVFLFGGVMAAFMIPAPAWFIALDLVAAYLPMAWLATRLAGARPR